MDQLFKEISVAEIPNRSQELQEKKRELNNQFDSKVMPIDGKFSGEDIDKINTFDGEWGKYRYLITKNEALAGDRHPITGVAFERKVIELPSGERVEGVFANFESYFDAQLPEEMFLEKDVKQFEECSRQLLEAMQHKPELKNFFTPEQIEQIQEGTAPDGYVWNHDAEAGKMQLVDFEIHQKTGHTGGRAVWGGGSDCR